MEVANKDRKKFPDFDIGGTYLEVTRITNKIKGKQQRDITAVFGCQSPECTAIKKNKELSKYDLKEPHYIRFGTISGHLYADIDENGIQNVADDVLKAIGDKLLSCKKQSGEHKVDLFLIGYDSFGDELLAEIIDWYRGDAASNYFENVFILYSLDTDENSKCLLRFNKTEREMKILSRRFDQNHIAKLIFECGWLDEKDYATNTPDPK